MGKYINSYKYRVRGILITILSIVIVVLLCSVLFGRKINRIGSQLQSYNSSGYSYIYKLNYPLLINDEYIYADTSIFLYRDGNQSNRISTTVLMQNDACQYTPNYLGYSSSLSENEIVISRNIADKYKLSVGDLIFALYPYSTTPCEMTVKEISNTNYDFENPDVDNDIGIVIFGYNEQYALNTENKTLCFSEVSLSSEISQHPQMLDSIVSKSLNSEEVFGQGLYILVFAAIVIIAALVTSEIFFYNESFPILKRYYLKGMSIQNLFYIPFVEHIAFSFVPLVLSIIVVIRFIPAGNEFVQVLYLSMIAIVLVYCVCVWMKSMKYRSYRVR